MAGLGWLFGELKSYGFTDTKDKEVSELIDILNKFRKADGKPQIENRQNKKYGEKETEESSEKVLTDDPKGSNISSYPKTKGFKNERDRSWHKKHIIEMGFSSVEEYEKAGVDFVNNFEGETFKIKNKNYKYDDSTTAFSCVGDDTNLITFYYAKNGNRAKARKYIDNLKKGEKHE